MLRGMVESANAPSCLCHPPPLFPRILLLVHALLIFPQADCLYRAFNDAPIVPSTTVSNKTLSLLLHMRKSDPAAPTEGKEGEGVEEAGGNGGDDKRDDDPGGGAGGPKERGEGTKEEQSSGGVGEGEDRRHARGATASSDKSEGEGDPSSDKGKVVLVSTALHTPINFILL